MNSRVAVLALAAALPLAGCVSDRRMQPPWQPGPVPDTDRAPDRNRPHPRPPEESYEFIAMAPGLRVDAAARVVEFDGRVATDVHHPDTPVVYLEVLVCSRDTREHEALVVTDVAPSLVHAALLAAGFVPGVPGALAPAGRREPTGDPVRVEFLLGEGPALRRADPTRWVVNADTDEVLADSPVWGGLVFAGSVIRERAGRTWYGADGEGTIVGLATFGTETIAPTLVLSPESRVDAPVWVARAEAVPAVGTPVRVRVLPVGPGAGGLSAPGGA